MLKKAVFFSFCTLLSSQSILAQKDTVTLQRADSLFEVRSYERAYTQYRQLVRQHQQASPRMLLRMAYVQEGEGHYPAALYYLSLALVQDPRRTTWNKMTALAQQHRLTGYPNTWRQQVTIVFQRYYYRLLQAALAVAVAGGTLLWLRRRHDRGWWLVYASYLVVTGLFLNLLGTKRSALVVRPRAALMAGPSPGATWLTTAAAGDRLTVLGQQDVWYRVSWHGKDAYIRQNDLLEI